jgi:deazaflavin-dependent oxidoreductase (nitroreductase family)
MSAEWTNRYARRMPRDLTLKAMNTFHRMILRASGGRLGTTTAGMPVFEVTTIGRKSGQPRSVLLTSPLRIGPNQDEIVLVGSRGGDDNHPAWYLNLVADPLVSVVAQSTSASNSNKTKVAMRARIATSEERANLWPKITGIYQGYGHYQAKTNREIPVVILDPIDAP